MGIRVFNIVNDSVVDGPGIRLTIFTQGCFWNCLGCHNPATHDPNGGYLIDQNEILAMIKKNPLLDGVTFSGGEPFLQSTALAPLAKEIKKIGLNVIAYTGYHWEALQREYKLHRPFLEEIDILIDGPYQAEHRSLALKYAGSTNQRIIDVQKSLVNQEIILVDHPELFIKK